MAEFPAFPLWTDAYLGDTTHLTTIEHGAFLLLLFTAWRTATYDLPDDDKILSKYCRLTLGQWVRIKPTVMAYWKLRDGRWFNGRLLDERDAVRRKVAQRSDAGKASALKRLHRSSTDVQREAYETSTSKATPTTISELSKKEPAVAALPDWIDLPAWQSFLDMRKKKRAPVTARTAASLIKKLDGFRLHGHDPTAIIDQSTINAWTDFYELKGRTNGTEKQTAIDKHLAGLASLHSRYGSDDDTSGGFG